MFSPLPHSGDFLFAQNCLEGDAVCLARLQSKHGPAALAYLMHLGATVQEARETVDLLWGDLVRIGRHARPRLACYDGTCALQTWLNAVVFNALLTRKRIADRRAKRFVAIDSTPEGTDAATAAGKVEAPLLLLLREAIEFAFEICPAEDFVLLQLEHCDQLKRDELARMFCCSPSTISRSLDTARSEVGRSAMEFLRQRDPWLELQWEDFVELCRTATPACFGLED